MAEMALSGDEDVGNRVQLYLK